MRFRKLLQEYTITVLFIVLGILMCILSGTPFPTLMRELAFRITQNGILVIALLPPLQAGMGFNFGAGVGAWTIRVGFMIAASYGLSGMPGTSLALALGLMLAAGLGASIGWLLSRMPGLEMLMTLILIPLATVPLWLLTRGIRILLPSPALSESHSYFMDMFIDLRPFQHSIDFEVHIGSITLPVGTIVILALAALLALWFQKSQPASNTNDPGENHHSRRTKIIAFALSLMLVCLSNLIVLQDRSSILSPLVAPRSTFAYIPALIAGGALLHKARLHHAFLGMVALNVLYIPLANMADISEVAKVIISNGLILYALVRTKTAITKNAPTPEGILAH